MAFDVPSNGTVANDGTGTSLRDQTAIVASLARAANAGQFQGGKNFLINGAMDVWQRGTSFASTTILYTADRWKFRRNASSAGATISRQTGFSGARYCARVQRDSGNAATDSVYFGQQIESANCVALAGKNIRISCDVRSGANYSDSAAQLRLIVETGTGTDESANLTFATGNVQTFLTGQSISATAARVKFPVHQVPSNAAELALWFSFNPSGTAGAADYFEITNVQVEIVDDTDKLATPYERRPHALELALCERYYEQLNSDNSLAEFAVLQCISTTVARGRLGFRTRKRTTPTTTFTSATSLGVDNASGTQLSVTALSANFPTPDSIELSATVASGLVAGNAAVLRAKSSTAPIIAISAEL